MSTIKKLLKSSRVRVTLALVVIGLSVILVLLGGSREADPNVGLGNDPNPPTIGITNSVGSLNVNRGVTYREVLITATQVQEASAFSDDRKHDGLYTVRVMVHVQPSNAVKAPLGLEYASLIRLVLADGEVIAPKLLTVYPIIFPKQAKDGYFDFPVSTKVDLSTLTLRIGTTNTISFSG